MDEKLKNPKSEIALHTPSVGVDGGNSRENSINFFGYRLRLYHTKSFDFLVYRIFLEGPDHIKWRENAKCAVKLSLGSLEDQCVIIFLPAVSCSLHTVFKRFPQMCQLLLVDM